MLNESTRHQLTIFCQNFQFFSCKIDIVEKMKLLFCFGVTKQGTINKCLPSLLIDFSVNWNFCIPLFFTDNIKLDWIPTNIKWKQHDCFTFYFEFWEGIYLCEKLWHTATGSFISCRFKSVFISADIIFTNFIQH